jgi:predicted MFS family arabinose efflux permease
MNVNAPARGVAITSIAAMTVSMLPLFVLGALGPVLVPAFHIASSTLGILVASGFCVATLLSIPGGSLVDRVGPRRCLIGLFLLSGCGLGVLALSYGPGTALFGVVLGGAPQALANPATNKVIVLSLPPERRGSVLGLKQSGVQLGAFVAGVPLASSAPLIGWRMGVATLALLCGVFALFAARILRADPSAAAVSGATVTGYPGVVWGLAGFSVALGFGIVSVNTFLAVYASQRLGVSEVVAGALVAVLGIAGVLGRVGWSRFAGRRDDPATLLPFLAAGAVISTVAILSAMAWGETLLWLGAAGIGLFAVAANAVSMLVVVRAVPAARAGQASAVVSAGFFAGFSVGPLASGGLLPFGYGWAWCAVAVAFAVAGAVATAVTAQRREEVQPV